MEASHYSENRLLSRNTSDNSSQSSTNSTSREYVFAPVSYRTKLIIFTAMLSFGVYGFVANSLIIYFKHKKHRRRRRVMQRPFSRCLTEYFINSLALSDILSCLISLPLITLEIFVNYIKSDSICRLCRFFTTLGPVITILNLFVIGVERYLIIFHPFHLLSRRIAKRMVVGAWVLGVLITLVSVYPSKLVYFGDIGDDSYALVCKYDSSVPLHRALYTIFLFISYIVPSSVLTFINLRILKRQRSSQQVGADPQNTNQAASRIKVTRMFVTLIFAFILPYMAFVMYNMIRTALKLEVFTFSDDYIVRYFSISLVYANASISATILIYYDKLYLDFLSCFLTRSTRNIEPRQAPVDEGKETQDTPV